MEEMKPTFFKFYNEYDEVFKSCKSYKDAGILIKAMIALWETGHKPDVPEKLADKWRFLRRSLEGSRKAAQTALAREAKKKREKDEDFSLENDLETSQDTPENQAVEDNLCAQREQSVQGIKNIEDRIENKEYRIQNNNIDSKIDDSISINVKNSIRDVEGNERDIQSIPITIDDYDLYLSQQPSDNPTIEELEMWDSGATITNPTPAQQNHPTQGAEDIEEAVFQSICNHYRRAKNRPVTYTHKNAEKELGLEKSSFYQAIQSLVNQGRLKTGQVEFPDRTLPTYVPLGNAVPVSSNTVQMFVLPYINTGDSQVQYIIREHFRAHPFAFNPEWNINTFITHNQQSFRQAGQELSGICGENTIKKSLWEMILSAASQGKELLPA